MTTITDTVDYIIEASTWDERVARIRQIPQRHGTNEHGCGSSEVSWLRCEDEPVAVFRVVDAFVLAA
jgi:hypothetical protein